MDSSQVEKVYCLLLDAWNTQDAKGMASLFAENGSIVGFDGSQMNSASEIETEMSRIFSHHETASFVAKVREVRFLYPTVVLLRAVAGMVPPGQNDINPNTNAIQSFVAVKEDGL